MGGNNSKKEKVRLVTVIALILAIPLTVFLALKSQDIRNLAGPGNAVITTVPATVQVQPGDTNKSFDIHIDPMGEEVAGAEFVIDFDPNYMTNVVITPGPMFGGSAQVIRNCVNEDPNGANPPPPCLGYIHYAIGFPLGGGQSTTTPGVAATVTFNVSTEATGSMAIDFRETGTPVTLVSDINANNVIDTAVDGTLSIPSSEGARLYFSAPRPANPQSTNSSFNIDVLLDTNGSDVSGTDAIMAFTPAHLQVQNITTGDFTSYATPLYSNSNGTIEIRGNVSGTGSPLNGNGINVATITFRTTSASVNPTTVNYDFTLGGLNDSNVAEDGTGNDILESVTNAEIIVQPPATTTPSPTATATATATPTPSPSIKPSTTPTLTPAPTSTPSPTLTATPTPSPFSVSLKIKIQGRTRIGSDNSKTLLLTIQRVGGLTTTQTVTTSADGEANLALPTGTYNILVDANTNLFPNPGGYLARLYLNQSITQNQSSLDLSNVLLLGGDFNDDGVINEVDYTLRMLPNIGKSDSIADLDGSTQVNSLDFALMRANWGLIDDAIPQ